MHIPHLVSDTPRTPEAFAALLLTPKPIILELLAPREPRPLPPIILTSAIAGWGLTRNFDDGLQTSKLVVKLQRLNIGFQDKIPPTKSGGFYRGTEPP